MAVYYGKITYINEEGVKLIGAKNYRDLIGKNIEEFIHPDYKSIVFQRMHNMIVKNQHVEPLDIKLIDVNGNEIDARVSSVAVDYQRRILRNVLSFISCLY